MPGSNNNINVIDRSSLMVNYLRGIAPHAKFIVNGHEYNSCYFLANGIYSNWTIFQKTIDLPKGEKRKWYAKMQEGTRKNIERACGVLQACWGIIRQLVRL